MYVYVDESKSKAYIVAAVIVEPGRAAGLRSRMKKLLMPRQGHLHFVDERPSRRKQILSEMIDMTIRVRIYRAKEINHMMSRALCMAALLDDLEGLGATSLIFERDDSVVKSDEILLRQGLTRRGLKKTIEFRHVGKSEEPLVWIADAMAWSFARGEDYRRRAMFVIEEIIEVTA